MLSAKVLTLKTAVKIRDSKAAKQVDIKIAKYYKVVYNNLIVIRKERTILAKERR